MPGVPVPSRGSYIAVHDVVNDAVFVLDNARHEYAADVAREGILPADGSCWSEHIHRGNVVQGLTVLAPEDEPSSIESNALVQNYVYDVYLRRSTLTSGGMFDVLFGAMFVGIAKQVQPGRGVSRLLVIQFEGGTYVPGVSLAEGNDVYDYLETNNRI